MKLGGRSDADVLEQALTGSLPRQRTGAETVELVALADGVRSLSLHITPRPEFRESLRARLIAEASVLADSRAVLQTWDGERTVPRQSDQTPGPRQNQRPDVCPGPVVVVIGRGWRRAVVGLVASLFVVGGATAVAATGSMPGELLYPVKRGVENLHLRLSTSDATRGVAHLDLARQRINEAERLIRDADTSHVTVVGLTLDAFEADTLAGERLLLAAHQETGDGAPLNDLNAFVADVAPQVQQIRQAAPEPLHDQIDALLRLLGGTDQILTRTVVACGQSCADLAAERERSPLAAPLGGSTAPGPDSTGMPTLGVPGSGPISAGETSPAPEATASTGEPDDLGTGDAGQDGNDPGRAGSDRADIDGGGSGLGDGGVVAPGTPNMPGSGDTRAPASGNSGDSPIVPPLSPPPGSQPSATSPSAGGTSPVDPALPVPTDPVPPDPVPSPPDPVPGSPEPDPGPPEPDPDPIPDPPVPDPGPGPDLPVPDPGPGPDLPVPDPGPVPDPPGHSLPGLP